MFQSIEKRSGELVFFEQAKITAAIYKAFLFTKPAGNPKQLLAYAEVASDKVIEQLMAVVPNDAKHIPSVEHIQDAVENVLMGLGEYDTARNYIKYRYEHKRLRDHQRTASALLELFEGQSFPSGKTLNGVHADLISAASSAFWHKECMDEAARHFEGEGIMKLKGLTSLAPRSFKIDLERLLTQGVNHIKGLPLAAPRHFDSALMQTVSLIGLLKCEVSETLIIHHADTLLCPFIRQDELSFAQIKQRLQSFISQLAYTLLPSTSGIRVILVFDKQIPSGLSDKAVILDGKVQLYESYRSYQYEANLFNLAFAEVLEEVMQSGFDLSCLDVVYQTHKDWDWQDTVSDKLVTLGLKSGRIHFSASDNRVWQTSIGSACGLVIRLEALAKRSQHMNDFFEQLESVLEASAVTLNAQMKLLEKSASRGMYPVLMADFRNHTDDENVCLSQFSMDIAIGGIDACLRHLTQDQDHLLTSAGIAFAEELVEWIGEKVKVYESRYGYAINLEHDEAVVSGKTAELDELLETYSGLNRHFKGHTAFRTQMPHSLNGMTEVKKLLMQALSVGGLPRFTFQ